MGKNHINFICDSTSLTSKLIDGNFPDYQTVIPLNMEKFLTTVDKNLLKIGITTYCLYYQMNSIKVLS